MMASSKVSRTGALAVGWLTAVLAVGASACGDWAGDVGGIVSCTISEEVAGLDSLRLCEEAPANKRQQLQQACMGPGPPEPGTLGDAGATVTMQLVDGPCTHAGALGACRFAAGGANTTIWYYEDGTDGGTAGTPADLQMVCVTAGATYVAP